MDHQHYKTRRRYELINQARFLTFSCYQRLPLFSNHKIKDAFVETLAATQTRTSFRLVAWVVMPEHVHLMILPALPEFPASVVLSRLKGQLSNRVLRRWRELNAPILDRLRDDRGKYRFWQVGGGYDRNIYSEREFLEKLDYIHENPVRRGLVLRAIDWRWSSAAWYQGIHDETLPEIEPIAI